MFSVLMGLGLAAGASAQWQEIKTAHTPPARTVAAFAQVKTGTLMFGGSGSTGMMDDLWLFSGGDWHDVSHVGAKTPPARCLSAMAAYGEGVVLFGGYGNTVHSLNDTWTWTPEEGWNEVATTTAPSGRSYHTMQAMGAGGSQMVVLFGGTARTDEAHDTALGDTWIFVEGQWEVDPKMVPPLAPNPRWGHSMVCQPPTWLEPAGGTTHAKCVLFGGAALSEDDHFDDTWMLNDVGWQQSQPGVARPGPKPAGRWSFQMASCGNGVLMAGGSIGYRVCTDDTWTFNATVFPSKWTTPAVNHDAYGEWKRQDPATHPGYLGGMAMARVNDGKLKGVLHFGGIEFLPPGATPSSTNTTRFWPETSCP